LRAALVNPVMTQSTTGVRRGAILAVTSGKGGVGKTNVVINLSMSLARLGYHVGVVDADFGLGNMDVLLGLTPAYHLGHLLTGEKTLSEITVEGPLGIRFIPAGTGIRALTALSPVQWERFRGGIRTISAELDFLLIDTASGISDNVVELLLIADRVIVVTSFEPAAIVGAYAVIKILTTASPDKDVGLVVNAVRDADEAGLVFRQLEMAAKRFLKRSLQFAGFIVRDPAVREAVLSQRAIVDYAPQAPASRCFRILASRISGQAGGGTGPRITPTIVRVAGSTGSCLDESPNVHDFNRASSSPPRPKTERGDRETARDRMTAVTTTSTISYRGDR
jgi:flagellar biosynthesis protein FlhG